MDQDTCARFFWFCGVMSRLLSVRMRQAVALVGVAALGFSAAECAKEPVEKITPSAAASSASDSGGAASAAPSTESPEVTDEEAYELVKPKVTPEEAADIYERAKTPVTNSHMPPSSAQLRPPSRNDYVHASEKSDQGAAETLAVYADAMFYAFSTGDARPAIEVVDTDACLNCAFYMKVALDDTQKGKYLAFPDIVYSSYS